MTEAAFSELAWYLTQTCNDYADPWAIEEQRGAFHVLTSCQQIVS